MSAGATPRGETVTESTDTPKRHESKGVQAYRIVMVVGMGILSVLSMRVLTQLDKTAELASSLQLIVNTMNSRLDAQADRIITQDGRIVRLENFVLFPPMRVSP